MKTFDQMPNNLLQSAGELHGTPRLNSLVAIATPCAYTITPVFPCTYPKRISKSDKGQDRNQKWILSKTNTRTSIYIQKGILSEHGTFLDTKIAK